MNKKLLYILVLGAVIGAALTFAVMSTPPRDSKLAPGESSSQQQEFLGKVICLPRKNDGPQTLECAYGVQTADGKNYAVKDSSGVQAFQTLQTFPTESHVVVTGTVSPPSSDQHYDIAGVIAVTGIRKAD